MNFTCSGCPTTWTGASRAHCSGCHRTFSSVTAFDAHRFAPSQTRPGTCTDPARLLRTHRDGTPATPLLRLVDGIWRSADDRPADTLPGQLVP